MAELVLGVSLGWAAGISPGPLFALVLTTSLRRGFRAGARMAMVPLLSDLPVVALSVGVLSTLSEGVVRGLSVAGGVYLLYLAVMELRAARSHRAAAGPEVVPAVRDLGRGVMVNLLSPHPWLFWIAVGGPILISAWRREPWAGAAFVGTFYALLVGSKVVVAWLVARGGSRLSEAWQARLAMLGAGLIAVTGVFLLVSGLT